jgi:hypothetical protein
MRLNPHKNPLIDRQTQPSNNLNPQHRRLTNNDQIDPTIIRDAPLHKTASPIKMRPDAAPILHKLTSNNPLINNLEAVSHNLPRLKALPQLLLPALPQIHEQIQRRNQLRLPHGLTEQLRQRRLRGVYEGSRDDASGCDHACP